MLKLIFKITFIFLLFSNLLLAQGGRQCATHDLHELLLAQNPNLAEIIEARERQTADFVQNYTEGQRVVVTIPVVVHIVWNTAAENVSDARVTEQLAVINNDFRKLNADGATVPAAFQGLRADCEINFCLAQRTPAGAPTTGIVRVQTSKTNFGYTDNMKYATFGSVAWDPTKYLNIWVCDISGLGFAYYPGEAPAGADGVAIDYTAFGITGAAAPYNLGRTATHEIGHYLNLIHIWGDSNCGNDQVSDTPTQQAENYGCPSFPHTTCSNGANGDMFMNFMDYVDDNCMKMFSTGQKARIQAIFATGGSRASLLTSLGCVPPGGGGSCGTPTGLGSSNVASTTATVSWAAVSGATSYNLQYKLSSSATWTTVVVNGTSQNLTGLTAASVYNFQVQAVCSGGNSAYSTAASFTTTSGGGGNCTDTYESNNTKATAKTIPVNTNITALISTSTDIDWFKFTNTTGQKNIRIDLTNLPANYDVRLYRGTTLVGTSANTGTTSEQIIYNNTLAATTYYVKITGRSGAFNATNCYTLNAGISSTNYRTDGNEPVEEQVLEPVTDKMAFMVYPNPASTNEVTLEMLQDFAGKANITILDLTGRIVSMTAQEMVSGNAISLDISRLQTGLFLVRVDNGVDSAIEKLIIQK